MFLPSIRETNIIYLGARIYFFLGKNSRPVFLYVFCSVQHIREISGCPYFENEKQKYIKYNTKGSLEGSLRDETADFGLTAGKHTRDTIPSQIYILRHKNRPFLPKIAPFADNCLQPRPSCLSSPQQAILSHVVRLEAVAETGCCGLGVHYLGGVQCRVCAEISGVSGCCLELEV